MQNVKWGAVIPATIVLIAIAVLMFKKDVPSDKSATTFRPVSSDAPLSTKPKKQADNDEHVRFDASVMPQIMADKISELFPDQSQDNINWAQPKYGWEAQFEVDGQEIEVEFDKSGNWIETELENVPRTMIPQRVLAAVQSRFPLCQFKEYEIEYTADGTFYEIEIMDGSQERELYYNDKGEKKTNTNED
jgi:uncharacterized membrane protein YkoI